MSSHFKNKKIKQSVETLFYKEFNKNVIPNKLPEITSTKVKKNVFNETFFYYF